MNTPFFTTVFAIIRKDLRAEVRSRELISIMGLFALLSIVIFSFALELDRIAREEAISGVLWVTVVFSSILGLNRSMTIEREQSGLDAMLLAPTNRSAIFVGKLVGNFIFTTTISLFLLPIMTVLYNKTLVQGWIVIILLLGVFGFAVIGTLLATMTVQTRAREALLPIVMLPASLPVLLIAVRACTAILTEARFADWIGWPQILVVVDIVFLVMCYLLFEFVVEE